MTKKLSAAAAAILALALVLMLAGCGDTANTDKDTAQSSVIADHGTSETSVSSPEPSEKAGVENSTGTAAESTAETTATGESDLFTSRDLSQTADLSEATSIAVSDSETVTITEAGVYILTGSADDAMVVIDAGDEDKVQLVLDGVSITNAHQPCILVENADKVFITSSEGSENALTVSGTFTGDEDAVIFSRDTLVLNGLGTVTVRSTNDGIRSNDVLKLTGGTWNVTAEDTAMKAHDSICACGGTYFLTATNDGLHAENNDDDSAGAIIIEGGTFTIQAEDDGVHATTSATVSGGALTITAAEGIEATQVIINDGTVNIKASDDGINAGQKSDALSIRIEINGGEVSIVMGAGDTDAVDSNGDLVITGGTIDISAQSPFDYDGNCSFTGGTVIVNGAQVSSITGQMMGGGPMGGGMPVGQPGGFGRRP